MHGHGERPHLCYYPGCERGIPGNGFPRRYNLFDHMKRVHDHKEEPDSLVDSPFIAGETQGQRRGGGRKRKATGATPEEPAAQRQRPPVPMALPQPAQAMPQPAVQGYPSYAEGMYASPGEGLYMLPSEDQDMSRTVQHRQRAIYSQWNHQRELITRQMDFVQSPDDEDNIERLRQNINVLRRLSEEARRG